MNIPFFNYPDLFKKDEQKLIEIFKDVGNRGAFIMQKDLEEFENTIKEYTGANHALGVANATDGLQIGLMAGTKKTSGEIIFSSHTMVATASAIHFAGYQPVPVDAGKDLMIDPSSIEKSITEATVGIMPTHLNGRTCNMEPILEIADKYSLDLHEDAAQALGSTFKGKSAGTFGASSAISLYPAKILGCLGDGGVVLTNDSETYEKMKLLRDHGRDSESGEVVCWGFNSRLDNLQAAFLNYFMSKFDQVVNRRREIASLYHENLKSLEELSLPMPPDEGDYFDVFQNYEIRARNRDLLQSHLKDNGIGSLVQWSGKAVHQFKSLNLESNLPYTDSLFQELLMIPLNMSITDEEVLKVVAMIKDFYSNTNFK